MTDSDLLTLSIADIAARIRDRQVSPVEVTQAALDRAERLRSLGTFIRLMPEAALAQARQREEAIGRGDYRGPLDGVPRRHQGQHRPCRRPLHRRLPGLRRLRSGRGRLCRAAVQECRRRHPRQGEHARAGRRRHVRQPPLRHCAQPLEHGPHPRGLQRGRRGQRRGRHHPSPPSAPTSAAPSARPRPTAASSASRPPSAASASAGWSPPPSTATTSARWPGPSKMPPSPSRPSPATTLSTPPASPSPSPTSPPTSAGASKG